jgi:hypothetical protein
MRQNSLNAIKTLLRMKCKVCGHWNRVPVNKIFIEPDNPEPKVRVLIPMYEPLQLSKCEKCGKVIAEPKELIRILQGKKE